MKRGLETMRAPMLAGMACLALCACDPHAADSSGPGQVGEPADAPASAPAGAFAGDFDVRGTEPFWILTIRAGRLLLTRADADDISGASSGPQVDGDSALWDGGRLTARLTRAACSDGMSDHAYAYMAEVSVRGGATLKGCADRKP